VLAAGRKRPIVASCGGGLPTPSGRRGIATVILFFIVLHVLNVTGTWLCSRVSGDK
jgi:hypothetical protein